MANRKNKIIILTQNDPFYLPEAINYFFETLNANYEVACIAILPQSVSGKRQWFFQKIISTLRTFGLVFFLKYSIKYVTKKLIMRRSIFRVAQKFDISTLTVTGSVNDRRNLQELSKYKPDVFVSIGASQIFKSELISMAPLGCLNLHTGLLPKYRGLMPTFWTLLNEEDYIGVSVFLVDEGIDSGPIVVQRKVRIENKSQSELIKCTKKIGMDSIVEALELLQKENVEYFPNRAEHATYFGFPTRQDVLEFLSKGKRF